MKTKTLQSWLFSHGGFTLLEIMLVVVIIYLLAGLLTYNFNPGDLARENVPMATTAVKGTLKTAIGLYQLHTDSYPSNDQWPQGLITKPAEASKWKGPYLDEVPIDPWGEPYQYRYPAVRGTSGYDVYSKGPDKTDGTADDIGNWPASVASQ